MANGTARKRPGRTPLWVWATAAAIVLACAAGGWAYTRAEPYARIGATYIAKQVCSCLFVAGRTEGSCRAEFKPDIDRFTLAVDRGGLPGSARVTTSLAVFRGEARYDRAFGCTVAR